MPLQSSCSGSWITNQPFKRSASISADCLWPCPLPARAMARAVRPSSSFTQTVAHELTTALAHFGQRSVSHTTEASRRQLHQLTTPLALTSTVAFADTSTRTTFVCPIPAAQCRAVNPPISISVYIYLYTYIYIYLSIYLSIYIYIHTHTCQRHNAEPSTHR